MIQKHIFNCYSYPFKKEIGYNNGLTLFICQIVSSLHNLRVKIHDLQKAFLNTIKKYKSKMKNLEEEKDQEIDALKKDLFELKNVSKLLKFLLYSIPTLSKIDFKFSLSTKC